MDLSWLKRDEQGLVTVVVQDRLTGMVRMVAHANEEAVAATLSTQIGHFYSRSRKRLWKKGEESGHFLRIHEVWADCDSDCLVYLVDPEGPSCHTGSETCFYSRVASDGSLQPQTAEFRSRADTPASTHAAPVFPRLWQELEARRDAPADRSYTRALLDKGAPKIAAKLREEGDEVARAVEAESEERVVSESADVIYHLLVGLLFRKRTLRDVQFELAKRFGVSGHDEKASRAK